MQLSWCCRDHIWPNQPLQATATSGPRLSGTTFGVSGRLRDMMISSVLPGWIVDRLPAQVSDELRWVRDVLAGKLSLDGPLDVCARDILRGEAVVAANRCQGDLRGGLVRAVNIFRGSAQAGSLKACNLFLGTVRGGKVEVVNLVVGDLLRGIVRDVNVMVGNVRGGSAHSLNAVIGDVYGGSVTGVHVLVGNVYGGVVEATVLVGDIKGGKVRADVHLGRRTRSAKRASRKRVGT
jgi:hypothetical protein